MKERTQDCHGTVGGWRNYLWNCWAGNVQLLFSWVMFSKERGQRQTGFRGFVASSKEPLDKDMVTYGLW